MTGNFLKDIKKKIGSYFSPEIINHDLISPFAIEIIETLIIINLKLLLLVVQLEIF